MDGMDGLGMARECGARDARWDESRRVDDGDGTPGDHRAVHEADTASGEFVAHAVGLGEVFGLASNLALLDFGEEFVPG